MAGLTTRIQRFGGVLLFALVCSPTQAAANLPCGGLRGQWLRRVQFRSAQRLSNCIGAMARACASHFSALSDALAEEGGTADLCDQWRHVPGPISRRWACTFEGGVELRPSTVRCAFRHATVPNFYKKPNGEFYVTPDGPAC